MVVSVATRPVLQDTLLKVTAPPVPGKFLFAGYMYVLLNMLYLRAVCHKRALYNKPVSTKTTEPSASRSTTTET